MARFYGSIHGARGAATRLGGVASGLSTQAAGWQGAVFVQLYDKDGVDYCRVQLAAWQGKGRDHVLYEGPVNPDNIGSGYENALLPTLRGQRYKKDPA